jgi:ATP-dependent DNA ligase
MSLETYRRKRDFRHTPEPSGRVGSRSGFGALLVGVYEGDKLRYAGEVGTEFDNAALTDIHGRERLRARRRQRTGIACARCRGSTAYTTEWMKLPSDVHSAEPRCAPTRLLA